MADSGYTSPVQDLTTQYEDLEAAVELLSDSEYTYDDDEDGEHNETEMNRRLETLSRIPSLIRIPQAGNTRVQDVPDRVVIQPTFNSDDSTEKERIARCCREYRPREEINPAVQPGKKFNTRNGLKLEFTGAQSLHLESLLIFINNVSATSGNVTFLGDHDFIRVLKLDQPSGIVESKSIFKIYPILTAPNETSMQIINHLTIGRMNNKEWLVTAHDYGRIMVFDVERLLAAVEKYADRPNKETEEIKFYTKPDLVFEVEASAWAISIHERLNLLAVSCNSGRVTVFDLTDVIVNQGDSVGVYPSPFLRHNIPEIQFIDPAEEDVEKGFYRDDAFYLYAVSIEGDVVLWEFFTGKRLERFLNRIEGRDENVYTTAAQVFAAEKNAFADIHPVHLDEEEILDEPFSRYLYLPFNTGRWLLLKSIDQQAWTVNTLNEADFMHVDNLYELTGMPYLNETNLFKQLSSPIHLKHAINQLTRSPETGKAIAMSDRFYNFAMRFIHLPLQVMPLEDFMHASVSDEGYAGKSRLGSSGTGDGDFPVLKQPREQADKYIHGLNNGSSRSQNILVAPPLKNRFVLVTARKSIYLFRAETLLCNTSAANVFSRPHLSADGLGSGGELNAIDRINFVKTIPALSAIVVGTQLGALSIFRLVRYKSAFALRQEFLFPVTEMFSHERITNIRTIAGLSVVPVVDIWTRPHEYHKCRIYIYYTDGTVLVYTLSREYENPVMEIGI
ncbi:hypothetical protein DV454_005187 [Geotrichum candidum]|nr:hypothetical protein DV454_005187 [Geotrichum candidum]